MGAEHEAAASAPVEEPATAAAVAGPAFAGFAPGRALDPRTALVLQRSAGNRAVSQMVARQTPPAAPSSADADFDELEAVFEQAMRDRTRREAELTAQARAPLDEALRKGDGTAFLTALRGLSDVSRGLLAGNAAFLADMRRAFHGKTLLRISVLLRHGQRRPDHIVQLLTAIDDRDAARVADILRARAELRNPDTLPGLREAVTEAFAGTPSAALMGRILSEAVVGTAKDVSQSYRETHFEIPAGKTAYELQVMGGTGAFRLERTASEIRVIVTIGLTEVGGTGHLTPELIATWRSGIEANWNNRFDFSNGTTTLPVVFVPLFDRRGAGDHAVSVAPLPPPSGRADQSNWHAKMDGSTAAHEFGHMLGNIDEYRLTAKATDISASLGLDAPTTAASNQEGLEAAEKAATGGSVQWAAPVAGQPGRTSSGIMGNQAGKAQGRNVATVLAAFNANQRQPGEAEFRVRVH